MTRRHLFEKPAISIPGQVVLLRRRGLVVNHVARAERCLERISSYRLRPYWLPFEIQSQHDGDHAFRKGATFEDVLTLYLFDQQLRRLVLDGIEPVEVALRARWAHHMATTHGPHGYLNMDLYHDATRYRTAVDMLTRQFQGSQDTFAQHYREMYDSPPLPPAWMAAEVMSFGQLLAWMVNLEHRRDKQAITRPFELDERVFTSFCGQLRDVRNICAHHGRLWNKRFGNTIRCPTRPVELAQAIQGAEQRRLHNTLAILNHLLGTVAPKTPWREQVVHLINGCPLAVPISMGFPVDWQIRSPWRLAD